MGIKGAQLYKMTISPLRANRGVQQRPGGGGSATERLSSRDNAARLSNNESAAIGGRRGWWGSAAAIGQKIRKKLSSVLACRKQRFDTMNVMLPAKVNENLLF